MHDIKSAAQSASTTWVWRLCKMSSGSHLQGIALAKPTPPRSRRVRDRYEITTITFRFRGGAESSWLVGHSGSYYRVPGWMCVEDCFALVLREVEPWTAK
jgi:hypothetical protein